MCLQQRLGDDAVRHPFESLYPMLTLTSSPRTALIVIEIKPWLTRSAMHGPALDDWGEHSSHPHQCAAAKPRHFHSLGADCTAD